MTRMYSPGTAGAAAVCRAKRRLQRRRSGSSRFIVMAGAVFMLGAELLQVSPVASARSNFVANQVLDRLAPANEGKAAALHHDFGGERARIIIGDHGESIGAGAHQRSEITLFQFGHLAILGEK